MRLVEFLPFWEHQSLFHFRVTAESMFAHVKNTPLHFWPGLPVQLHCSRPLRRACTRLIVWPVHMPTSSALGGAPDGTASAGPEWHISSRFDGWAQVTTTLQELQTTHCHGGMLRVGNSKNQGPDRGVVGPVGMYTTSQTRWCDTR